MFTFGNSLRSERTPAGGTNGNDTATAVNGLALTVTVPHDQLWTLTTLDNGVVLRSWAAAVPI